MVDINKKEFYFDIIICIIAIFEICFWRAQEPILLYMGAFVTWGCISLYALCDRGRRASLLCFQITFFVFLLGGTLFSYIFEKMPLFIFSDDVLIYTYGIIYLSQITMYMSYRFCEIKTKNKMQLQNKREEEKTLIVKIRYYSLTIMMISMIPSLLVAFDSINYVSATSYEDLYLRGSNNLPFFVNKLEQLFSISFFMYLATKPKKKQAMIPTIIFLSVRCITLATGRRTDFVLALMIVFFYFFIRNYQSPEEKWIGKREIILICIMVPILILVLVNVSNMRYGNSESLQVGQGITNFFKDQGVSITVIEYGKELKSRIPQQWYLFGPIMDFLKYNEITQLFFNFASYGAQTIEQALHGASFADTISYLVIPYDYSQGAGLGSCYIAEAYQTLGLIGVILVNFIYGWVLNFINNRYGKTIAGSTFAMFALMRLFYAPRSSSLSFLSSTFTITNLLIIYGGIQIVKHIHLKKINLKLRDKQI